MTIQKRKTFNSHYVEDHAKVGVLIRNFSDVFISEVLGSNNNDNFIYSSDINYVMQRIRYLHIQDSTVTIMLLGVCSDRRVHIDKKIKSSLQKGIQLPNGSIAIVSSSRSNLLWLPKRFNVNWAKRLENCYARYWSYPETSQQLSDWIDDAHQARITLPRLTNDPSHDICGVIH